MNQNTALSQSEGAAAALVGADMTLIYGEVLNPLHRRTFTLSRETGPGKDRGET